MPTRVIRIVKGYSDGRLDLSDRGHTIARPGDTILWQIDQHSGVDSIISIQEKIGSTNIFSTPPHAQGANWTGVISSTAPECTIYVYSINWSDGTASRVCDPIISIKPSKFSLTELVTLTALATFFIGVGITLLFLKKKKRSK